MISVGTEHQSRKLIHLTHASRSAFPFTNTLYRFPSIKVNNRLVGIFKPQLLFYRIVQLALVLVEFAVGGAVDGIANVVLAL